MKTGGTYCTKVDKPPKHMLPLKNFSIFWTFEEELRERQKNIEIQCKTFFKLYSKIRIFSVKYFICLVRRYNTYICRTCRLQGTIFARIQKARAQ